MPRMLAILLPLVFAAGLAFAQGDRPTPTPATSERSRDENRAIKERAAEYLARCFEDWDKATHMTKKEWDVTCRRVAAERETFLLEHPLDFPVQGDATKTRRP